MRIMNALVNKKYARFDYKTADKKTSIYDLGSCIADVSMDSIICVFLDAISISGFLDANSNSRR